jgi:glycosyltransferase involved in cell wall biosynthesis
MVVGGNPLGGAVVETFVWMKALHELGYSVIQSRNLGDKRALKPGFDWIKFQPSYDPNKGIKWLRWVSYRFPRYFQHLKNANPDFVYESIPTWSSFFTAIMCKMLGVKLILRIANDNMLDKRILITHTPGRRFLIYRAFGLAEFIFPQNKYQFSRLTEMFPGKRIHLLYNPFVIDAQYLVPKKAMNGYVAWVANFRYQKNLKLLHELAEEFKEYQFKIAGAPLLPLDDETSTYLNKLREMENVEFVGTIGRESILDFFSKAIFLLNTSRYEGFSNTFLEAMATGTPILTSNSVNPDGIIDTYELGLVYSTAEDLRKQIKSVDENVYGRMSNNCCEYINMHHGHIQIGKDFISILENNN